MDSDLDEVTEQMENSQTLLFESQVNHGRFSAKNHTTEQKKVKKKGGSVVLFLKIAVVLSFKCRSVALYSVI